MPYCIQCGNQVQPADTFCAKCGTRQPSAQQASKGGAPRDLLGGMSPRTASVLCYIPMVGWVAAIIVLAAAKFRADRMVRFHAFQGLYLYVAWLIVDWVVKPFFSLLPGGGGPEHMLIKGMQILIFGAWILMMVKVSQSQDYRLPVVGDLAEKSLSEQV